MFFTQEEFINKCLERVHSMATSKHNRKTFLFIFNITENIIKHIRKENMKLSIKHEESYSLKN